MTRTKSEEFCSSSVSLTFAAFVCALSCLVLSGCTEVFNVDIKQISSQDGVLEAEPALGLERNTPDSPGGYLRILFQTSLNIEEAAKQRDVGLVSYTLYPCTRPVGVTHGGDIYAVAASGQSFEYAAYIPSAWRQLTWRKPTGEVVLGWPPEAENQSLCFRVSGFNMLHTGIESREIVIEGLSRLMR